MSPNMTDIRALLTSPLVHRTNSETDAGKTDESIRPANKADE
jgi:hypothetical protein